MVTLVLAMPSAFTRLNSTVALAGASRTQPCDTASPRCATSEKPWMAWPRMSKNMVCGIGALSHSWEKWLASMRFTLKVPFGVS